MVPALVGHFVAVIARPVQAAVPVRLPGIYPIPALLRRHLITHLVKKIKFKFRPDNHPICNAAFFHIVNGPQAYVLGVLVKGPVFPFSYGADISAHGQCRHRSKGIHISGIRIRQKDHITFFNRRIAVIGAVKADSIGKSALPEPLHRNGNVTPASVNIRHLKVDHADFFFFAKLLDFLNLVHYFCPVLSFCLKCTVNLLYHRTPLFCTYLFSETIRKKSHKSPHTSP